MRLLRRSSVLAISVVMSSPTWADRVQLRSEDAPLDGEILVMNDDGITIAVGEQPMRIIPWDRVEAFELDRPDPNAARYAELGMKLWRARSRVERGDTRLASPVFEELFPQYFGKTSETALVVMEGLLRSKLDQGANDLAVIPALEVARLRLKGVSTSSYSQLPPVLDDDTLLCMVLPPAWAPSSALTKVERQLAEYDAGTEPVIIAYASLYRQAMRRHLGLSVDLVAGGKTEQKGVQLMMMILETSSAVPDVREGSRERLLRQSEELGEWTRAWARYFVGLSMLNETGDGRHQEGIVNLLHVPARYSVTQPYLAGLALAKSSQALAAAGNTDAAVAIDDELRRSFPSHPVLLAGGHRPITRTAKDSS